MRQKRRGVKKRPKKSAKIDRHSMVKIGGDPGRGDLRARHTYTPTHAGAELHKGETK